MFDRLIKSARDGLRVLPFTSSGGQSGPGYQDWSDLFTFRKQSEQKPAWQNSAIGACIGWAQAVATEPPLVCKRTVEGDPDGEIVDHPIQQIVTAPTDAHDFCGLLGAYLLSHMTDGNTYLYKERSASGKVIGLRYLPHFQVAPQWPADGSEFISHYLYSVDTGQFEIAKENIIHIRNGIDPERTRYGRSPVKQIVREVLTDNEAAVYAHAILRNMGMVGAVLSPKDSGVSVAPENIGTIGAKWRENYTGDGRGSLMILSDPMELKEFGTSPEKMVLDKVRKIPTDRICAAYRIPPAVVGLAGSDPTYSNLEGYTRIAWQSCLLPTLRQFASAVWGNLAQDITGGPQTNGLYLEFETSAVGALQRDVNLEADRLHTLYQGGIIRRGEARRGAGYSSDDKDEVYYTDLTLGSAMDEAKAALQRDLKERARKNREDYERIQSLIAESQS